MLLSSVLVPIKTERQADCIAFMEGMVKAIQTTLSKIYSSTSSGSKNKHKKDATSTETISDTDSCQN